MSNSVENKVVSMTFNNAAFERAARVTMGTLQKLREAVNLKGAGNNLNSITAASNKVSLGGISGQIDKVKVGFLALSTIGVTALATLTSKAISAGANFAKSFTVAPIMDGLREYETNLKSIQTIRANTDQPLSKITASLEELNRYSDLTIYNFSEMARNIGTFTAAGVDLKTATSSIKGIANLAAMSGSSSEQAAGAMYQLSQAIAAGKVGLMDWNSVVNAGMGGKKLQTALAQTAVAMGKLDASAVKSTGSMKKLTINGQSFRESISASNGESWLESDVLVNTLAVMDGRFSKVALMAERTSNGLQKYTEAQAEAKIATARTALEQKNGVKYTDAQFESLMRMSDQAFMSATEVKTLGQVFDVAAETMGSGWAATFQNIFGDLGEATKLFTGMSNTINDFINANSLARNSVLAKWKEIGGRASLISGVTNIFKALAAVLKPIGQAFRDVFPRKSAEDLLGITKSFENFTKHLIISKDVAEGLRGTFGAVFAVIHILQQVISGVIKYFATLAGLVLGNSGGIFELTGNIGDLIVKLDEWLSKGQYIQRFFDAIIEGRNAIYGPVLKMLGDIISAFADLISGGPEAFVQAMKSVPGDVADLLNAVGSHITHILSGVGTVLGYLLDHMGSLGASIKAFGIAVGDSLTGSKDAVVAFLRSLGPLGNSLATVLSGSVSGDSISNVFSSLGDKIKPVVDFFIAAWESIGNVVGPIADNVGSAIQDAFGNLPTMLQGVVGALGPVGKAISGLFGSIGKSSSGSGSMSLPGMDTFAPAMSATDKLKASFQDLWDKVKPILQYLGDGIKDFGGFLKDSVFGIGSGISNLAGMIGKAFSEVGSFFVGIPGPVASGIKTFFSTIGSLFQGFFKDFTMEDTITLLQTGYLAAIALAFKNLTGSLSEMGRAASQVMSSSAGVIDQFRSRMVAVQRDIYAGAILKIAAAVLILAAAIWILSKIPPKKIAISVGSIVVLLSAMVIALKQLQSDLEGIDLASEAARTALMSVALLALAASVLLLSAAVAIFGNMDTNTLVKGLTSVGVVLGGLAAMANFLSKSGAASGMISASISLGILAASMMILAGVIKIYSMLNLGMLVEGTIKLALVIVALGLAMTAMSGAQSGAVSIAIMSASLLMLIPALVAMSEISWGTLLKSIIALVALFVVLGLAAYVLAPLAPVVLTLAGSILLLGLAALAVGAGLLLFSAGLAALAVTGVAGAAALAGVIVILASTIPIIARQIAQGIIGFARVIAANGHTMVEAFSAVIGAFLTAVNQRIPQLGKVLITLINTGLRVLRSAASGFVSTGMYLMFAFLRGIANNIGRIATQAINIASRFMAALGARAQQLANAGARMIINFLNGVARAIRNNSAAMGRAGENVGSAIVSGMIRGLGAAAEGLYRRARSIAKEAIAAAKNALDINSPSRVAAEQIGVPFAQGIAVGINKGAKDTYTSAERVGVGAIEAMSKAINGTAQGLGSDLSMSPVIAPVLDLTNIRQNAGQLSSLIPDSSVLNTSFTASGAASISAIKSMEGSGLGSSDGVSLGTNITINQTNTSPKALDSATIYRQTKSLVSISRKALSS